MTCDPLSLYIAKSDASVCISTFSKLRWPKMADRGNFVLDANKSKYIKLEEAAFNQLNSDT